MVEAFLTRLVDYPELDLTGYLVSRRGRDQLTDLLPAGWRTRALRIPARPSHAAWRYLGGPGVRGFDLIHGPNYIVPPAPKAARLVTVHDLTAWRFPDMVSRHARHYPAQLRRAVRTGAHVHAVSAYVGAELVGELGVPEDRVHVIPNGFDPVSHGSRRAGQRWIGAPYVLAVGTIEPRKGYPALIEAMIEVWRLDPKIKLVIAGGDGWGREEFDATVHRLGVRDRIVLAGYVDTDTKADLLAGAELLAYPSIYEGFGLPLLEAMHAGIPVVSTTAGSIPEVAGDAAMLVDANDRNGLAAALVSVLEDRTLRRQMVSAGKRRAQQFSWESTVERLVDLYHELTDGRFRPVAHREVQAGNDKVQNKGVSPR
jgi:glycosyltransferase involved in cell wall biosynthesis